MARLHTETQRAPPPAEPVERETEISVDVEVSVQIRPIIEKEELKPIPPPKDVREEFTFGKLISHIPYLLFPWLLDIECPENPCESDSESEPESDDEDVITIFNLTFAVLWSKENKLVKLRNVVHRTERLRLEEDSPPKETPCPKQPETSASGEHLYEPVSETFVVKLKKEKTMPKQEITLSFTIKSNAMSKIPLAPPGQDDKQEIDINATVINQLLQGQRKNETEIKESPIKVSHGTTSKTGLESPAPPVLASDVIKSNLKAHMAEKSKEPGAGGSTAAGPNAGVPYTDVTGQGTTDINKSPPDDIQPYSQSQGKEVTDGPLDESSDEYGKVKRRKFKKRKEPKIYIFGGRRL